MKSQSFIIKSVNPSGVQFNGCVLKDGEIYPAFQDKSVGNKEIEELPCVWSNNMKESLLGIAAIYSFLPGFEDCSLADGRGDIRESSLWAYCMGPVGEITDLLCDMSATLKKMEDGGWSEAQIAEYFSNLEAEEPSDSLLTLLLGRPVVEALLKTLPKDAGDGDVVRLIVPLTVTPGIYKTKPRDNYGKQEWLTDEVAERTFTHLAGQAFTLVKPEKPIEASEQAILGFEQ